MKAVVLLGGEGTRLRPLTLTSPKQVLPIVEVPMIERVLDHLAGHGVTEVVLSLGYLNRAFVELFPQGRFGPVVLSYAVEPEPLDTGGAIAFAADQAGLHERFLVVNGDVLTDLDLSAMLVHHRELGAEATISLARVPDPSAFGLVHTRDSRVVEFVEKPPPGLVAGPGWVSAGTYVIEPALLERIPRGRKVSVERAVFPEVVASGGLFGFESQAYWTDTGTPAQYLAAQLDLLCGRRPGPPAPGAQHLGDGRWMLGQARVNGELVSPVLVGNGAQIARGAVVAGSVVGAGSRVQPGARVTDSVLLRGTTIERDAVVTGSIVGRDAVIGAEAVVAGLTVIGPDTLVTAGMHLDGARMPVAV